MAHSVREAQTMTWSGCMPQVTHVFLSHLLLIT